MLQSMNMYNERNSGPQTEPWGAPQEQIIKISYCEWQCVLPNKYEWNCKHSFQGF